MKITEEFKLDLDLAFSESTLNYIDIYYSNVEVLLDCLSMNSNHEFPDDDRHKFIFKDFGRIAISYRIGAWDDTNAEVLKIESNELKSKLECLKPESMSAGEFINLNEQTFSDWSDKISLNLINSKNWRKMNTIDLFAEQLGYDKITIDVRIWFEDFKVFDYSGQELTKKEFIKNGDRAWDQLYKTGIHSENHKTKILENKKTNPLSNFWSKLKSIWL